MGAVGGGAVSSAMNIGFQELNRAAAYGAQAAGIGVGVRVRVAVFAFTAVTSFTARLNRLV
ncbi:hypothetical protein MAHJHV59_47520 [Mycobacterium avium subsp. hominissuis]